MLSMHCLIYFSQCSLAVGTLRLSLVLEKGTDIEKTRWHAPIYLAIKSPSLLDSNPSLLALSPVISSFRALVLLSDPYAGILLHFIRTIAHFQLH